MSSTVVVDYAIFTNVFTLLKHATTRGLHAMNKRSYLQVTGKEQVHISSSYHIISYVKFTVPPLHYIRP